MTKRRKRLPLLLGILFLAGCLGLVGFRHYQEQFAYVGEARYEKTIESIDLSGQSIDDLAQLQSFPGLKYLNLRGTGLTCAEYETVKQWFPEAEILWDIPFQGEYYDMKTESLTITSLTEADFAVLSYFTELKSISAEACPDYMVLHALRQQRPDLAISYLVPVNGTQYSYDVTELTLPGGDVEALFDVLPCLTELEAVELLPPLAPADRLVALVEAFPEVDFSWNLELKGIPVNERTETLDLTGIPMTVEEMDAILPYLLGLTYVDMTDCGISNEEMDALDMRYENIKIVWTVTIGWMRYKTDITTFMPARDGMTKVYNSYLYNLRYCHDVIALDIGHMEVNDISFVAYMPNLQFLLLGDTRVWDLSPLEGLTELVYLELFMTNVSECDALLTLTALEDLNVSYTYCDAEVLAQMTWLKNLWWAKPTTLAWKLLPDALPDTHLEFTNKSSTGNGWRELPNYYAQRDLFGLHYMTG